jgi:hypothetical protein
MPQGSTAEEAGRFWLVGATGDAGQIHGNTQLL